MRRAGPETMGIYRRHPVPSRSLRRPHTRRGLKPGLITELQCLGSGLEIISKGISGLPCRLSGSGVLQPDRSPNAAGTG